MRKGKHMKQYTVDAFTSVPFSGNPAAVCVCEKWPSEDFMKKLAAENNLSETAYLVREEKGWHLRWFTPEVEVEICGHATLASAFVILNFYDRDQNTVIFHTLSGGLTVERIENRYVMDLPSFELHPIQVSDEMEKAFGKRPVEAMLGLDLICVFDNESFIHNMTPDQQLLKNLPGRIQNATAKGTDTDCVSRSFCPKLGIPEDPVCGSAHAQIASLWSQKLDRKTIHAYQASRRGGHLYCEVKNSMRVMISGEAVLISVSDIYASQ